MFKGKWTRTLALGGSLFLGVAGSATVNAATTQDAQVLAELQALRARVAELESNQGDTWLNERRAEEVKGLIRDVLADADTRASLVDNGMAAGHNGSHFYLASEDGSFLLQISGQIQFRYVANFRDKASSGMNITVTDEEERGFELRRTKLTFDGHIGDPRLHYEVKLSVGREDNDVSADKIIISYKAMDGLTIWGGEDKAPFLREELTSSTSLLAAERSLVNEVFTLGYIQGIGAKIDAGDMIKIAAAFSDGGQSGENGYVITQQSPLQIGDEDSRKRFDEDRSDFAITVRVDVKLGGNWEQMDDFSSWSDEEMAVFIGGAFHWEDGETGDSLLNNDFYEWTVDASLEASGFGLYAAVIGLHTEAESVSADDVDLFGLLVQGSFMVIPDKLEPFVRFEYLDLDNASFGDLGMDDRSIALWTFGVNYYLKKHDAKFTLDIVWSQDTIPVESSKLGLLEDDPGEDDQVAVRAQFQLLF